MAKTLKTLFLVAVVAVALLAVPTAAKADLPNPHVFLDYSTLDFVFTRTTGGPDWGTFSITDVSGTTLDAILRNNLSVEIDRATISSFADFDVSLSGTVYRLAPNVYSLVGTFSATDDTGTTKVSADFHSVSVTNPLITATNLFTIAGGLSTLNGGVGPILTGIVGDSWSFAGHAGDTAPGNNFGGDDLITILSNAGSYDIGDLVDFSLGNTFASLDALFASSTTIGGGDMKVTIIPAPGAVVLGLVGLGFVAGVRRRFAK